MEIEIRELQRKDFNGAISFAIRGMHFDWYMDSKFLLVCMEGIFGTLKQTGQHR